MYKLASALSGVYAGKDPQKFRLYVNGKLSELLINKEGKQDVKDVTTIIGAKEDLKPVLKGTCTRDEEGVVVFSAGGAAGKWKAQIGSAMQKAGYATGKWTLGDGEDSASEEKSGEKSKEKLGGKSSDSSSEESSSDEKKLKPSSGLTPKPMMATARQGPPNLGRPGQVRQKTNINALNPNAGTRPLPTQGVNAGTGPLPTQSPINPQGVRQGPPQGKAAQICAEKKVIIPRPRGIIITGRRAGIIAPNLTPSNCSYLDPLERTARAGPGIHRDIGLNGRFAVGTCRT